MGKTYRANAQGNKQRSKRSIHHEVKASQDILDAADYINSRYDEEEDDAF